MRSAADEAAVIAREAMLDWIETHWEVLAALGGGAT